MKLSRTGWSWHDELYNIIHVQYHRVHIGYKARTITKVVHTGSDINNGRSLEHWYMNQAIDTTHTDICILDRVFGVSIFDSVIRLLPFSNVFRAILITTLYTNHNAYSTFVYTVLWDVDISIKYDWGWLVRVTGSTYLQRNYSDERDMYM